MAQCQVCTAESDGYLCPTCMDVLARRVRELPELINEVSVVRARLDRVYRTTGARRHEPEQDADEHSELAMRSTAMPVNLDASELLWAAGDTVAAWTAYICRGLAVKHPPPPAEVLLWLTQRIVWMRADVLAGQCHDEMSYLHRTLTRAIDRSPDRLYAGPCTAYAGRCGLDLYVLPGRDAIVCDGHRAGVPGCGARYTTEQRRDWLVHEVESTLLPLAVLRAALEWLLPSVALPALPTWRSWRRRGRLVPHGVDLAGNELFSGAEVLGLVRDDRTRTGPRRRSG